MAITVKLYTFEKRENSTKRPSGGTDYSCTLIDDTSLMNPTFRIESGSNPVGKNYCYVSDFKRYYFVNDVRSYQGFWYISCACDVLASFKTEIGAESHYVLRSASQRDEYISDNAYISKIKQKGTHIIGSTSLNWNTGHSYVIGITGHAGSSGKQVGSVTYYQVDDTALEAFVNYLMQNINDWCNIPTADYDTGVQEALINPIQYIVSCMALPMAFPSSYTAVGFINFGYYHWNVSAGKVRFVTMGETHTETVTVSIPKHTQASRGKYMNCAPFSDYSLRFGPIGEIPIDPASLVDVDNIIVKIKYEMIQGQGVVTIGPKQNPDNNNITLINYCGNCQIGVPIQLSQAIIDPLKAQVQWQKDTSSIVTKGATNITPGGLFDTAFNFQNNMDYAMANALYNKYPQVHSIGSNGSMINFFDLDWGLYINYKYLEVVDEDISEFGRPLCKVKRLDSLSGYILCTNAECSITGTLEEAQKVNGYLNGGFFYE